MRPPTPKKKEKETNMAKKQTKRQAAGAASPPAGAGAHEITVSPAPEYDLTLRAEDLYTPGEVEDILVRFDADADGGGTDKIEDERKGFTIAIKKASYDGLDIYIDCGYFKIPAIARLGSWEKTVEAFYNRVNAALEIAVRTTPELYNRLAESLQSIIVEAGRAAGEQYAKIGFTLKHMRECGIFPGGMSVSMSDTEAFYQYAETAFGYKRSSVCNMISYAEAFCLPGSAVLADTYKEYDYSKLMVLRPLIAAGKLKELPPPDASYKQYCEIRDKVKGADRAGAEIVRPEFAEETAEENADVASRLAGGAPIDADKPGVIRFKNDGERSRFLKDYEKWPIWINASAYRLWVRRAALSDGSVLIARMYTFYAFTSKSVAQGVDFDLILPLDAKAGNTGYTGSTASEGYIVNYIRENKLFAVI
jgi:hypothetical protein